LTETSESLNFGGKTAASQSS